MIQHIKCDSKATPPDGEIIMLKEIYTIDYILKNEIDKNAYGFIYITTNLINGRKYIGQKMFRKEWKTYFGSGVALKLSFKKYGKVNFSRGIIDIAYSESELNELEIEFIKEYNAVKSNNYYNIAEGGKVGSTIAGLSEQKLKERSRKLSLAFKGKKLSPERIKKASEGHMGLKHTDESKLKISEALKGRIISEEWRNKISLTRIEKHFGAWNKNIPRTDLEKENISKSLRGKYVGINNPNYGKTMSEEQKTKISNTRKENCTAKGNNNPMFGISPKERMDEDTYSNWLLKVTHPSENTKKKMSKSRKGKFIGKDNPSSKSVICLNTGEIFGTIKDATTYINKSENDSSISACCRRKRKSSGRHLKTGEKLKWMYCDEYLKMQEAI